MFFDAIDWDEANLDHACRRLTQSEIEQIITNADRLNPHPRFADRVLITAHTDGGKAGMVIAAYDHHRRWIRPITAWEVS